MMKRFDRIIIGAGLYGLYAAVKSLSKGYSVLLLEKDNDFFTRASKVNQARVHNGLHYPRSLETAEQCYNLYDRFTHDHYECINGNYEAIYAISKHSSKTSLSGYVDMMRYLNMQCEEIDMDQLFKPKMIAGAFKTKEVSFDYMLLKHHYIEILSKYKDLVEIRLNYEVSNIAYVNNAYVINNEFEAAFVLNATYAALNQVASLLCPDYLDIKYELCEVVLCDVSKTYKSIGITIMDGDFFSIMPWGNSRLHSLTSVHHTPHYESKASLPLFECMLSIKNSKCNCARLGTCTDCDCVPPTSFGYMKTMADSFLTDSFKIDYRCSLYTVKAILQSAEANDCRPTIIKSYTDFPGFYSVLSGKISTIYELDTIL